MVGERTHVGSLIDEKYVVIECLGRGGMANVWLARDERLGKLWAIKEIKLNAKGSRGEVMRQALVDEADFMKRLDHPAIPRIVDIVDTGRTVFVVMDYVDGSSLGKLLRLRGKPFEQSQVIDWGLQLCDVLSYLHSYDPPIVYRDMKPANVIVRDDGSVRLVDFGIAVQSSHGAGCQVAGTPGYAPPEQLPATPSDFENVLPTAVVDERSDVYALGTTLYSLVTGHTPQRTEDGDVSFELRPIREWDPGLSDGLERIIDTATQADQRDRYQTIDEMRYDLEHHEQLTQRWRNAQRRKLVRFRRHIVASCACGIAALSLMGAASLVRGSSYADLMHEAQTASRAADGDGVSDAERCYVSAIRLEPKNPEPYRRLLEVYENDYRLDEGEASRWQQACGGVRELAQTPGYARLCMEAGTCFLCYYGMDLDGGSVGNAAISSIDAAAAWFDRALAARSVDEASAEPLADADVRALEAYQVVSSFHDDVSRAGHEGSSAVGVYRSFWQALDERLSQELASSEADRCAEGVRARLCQVGVEALASPSYLAGFSRAGIREDQARSLLGKLRTCLVELEPFEAAQEHREVYGPLFDEVRDGLSIAEENIAHTYANPVRVAEAQIEAEEES